MKMYIGVGYEGGETRQVECNPASLNDMMHIIRDILMAEQVAEVFEITIKKDEQPFSYGT